MFESLHQAAQEKIELLADQKAGVIKKFTWDHEPANFREFITGRDHMNFPSYSDRQYQVADFMLGEDPKRIFENGNKLAVLEWGKGCAAGETVLTDYFTNRNYTVEQLYKESRRISVQCYDESKRSVTIELASVPWVRGFGQIIEVATKSGKKINVYKKHQFLSKFGWKKLDELKVGDEILDDNCLCGCGSSPSPGRQWIHNHHNILLEKMTPEERKEKFSTFGHLGKKHSAESLKKNSDSNKRVLTQKYQTDWGDSQKERLSSLFSGSKNPMFGKSAPYGSGRCRYYKYKDYWLQGEWELRVAKHLDELGIKWEKCRDRFKYIWHDRERTYNPDFKVFLQEGPIYLEVKGWTNELTFLKKEAVEKSGCKLFLIDRKAYKSFFEKWTKPTPVWDTITSISYVRDDYYYDLEVPKHHNYLAHGLYNHNSGKDTISCHIILYVIHVLMCMRKPQDYFPGIGPNDTIDCINVAYSAAQATAVFFDKLKNNVLTWSWLKRRYPIKLSGKVLDPTDDMDFRNIVTVNQNSIFFPKRVRAFSRHSEQESTEGLNILCLSGDTQISLLDGRDIAIKDLVGEEMFWVYSWDEERKKIVAARGHSARLTKKDAEVFEVMLDNSQTIKCTGDHPFLMRDGTFKEASLLVEGDSLMPLYKRISEKGLKGRPMMYQPETDSWHYTHREIFKLHTGQKGKRGFVLHHININKFDNRPCNLVFLKRKEHDLYHAVSGQQVEIRRQRKIEWWKEHPEYRGVVSSLHKGKILSDKSRKKISVARIGKKMPIESVFRMKEKMKGRKLSPEHYAKIVAHNRAFANDPERIKKLSLAFKGKTWNYGLTKETDPRLKAVGQLISSMSRKIWNRGLTKETCPRLVEIGANISKAKNHKVVSVRNIGREDVYDLTVEKYHNFALSSGIFVHNCFVADEISAFKDKTKTRNSTKIYNMLDSSSSSRFGSRVKGFLLSYPRYKGDFIEKIYDWAKGQLHIYADKADTGSVKPAICFSGKTFEYRISGKTYTVPLEFKEHFDRDPGDACAKYLCEPPGAESPFIERPELVDLCIDKDRLPLIEFEDYTEGHFIKKRIKRWNIAYFIRHEFVINIDLGLKSDSAGFSMHHSEKLILPDQTMDQHIIQDAVTAWKPDRDKKLIVDFQNVEDIIKEISLKMSILGVWFDQWNSAQMVQRLSNFGIKCETYMLNLQDYKNLKEKLYFGRIHLLDHNVMVDEIKGLEIFEGRKVDHPEGGGKDIADTIVGAIKVLVSSPGSIGPDEGEIVGENIGMMEGEGELIATNMDGTDGVHARLS